MKDISSQPLLTFKRSLQDRHELRRALEQLSDLKTLHLNILIYVIWFAYAKQGRLRQRDIRKILHTLTSWHTKVLEPLKCCKELLLQSNKNIDTELLKLILTEYDVADSIEQCLLFETASGMHRTTMKRQPKQRLSDACQNIAIYCRNAIIHLDSAHVQALIKLLQAIFSDCDVDDVAHELQLTFREHHISGSLGAQLTLV